MGRKKYIEVLKPVEIQQENEKPEEQEREETEWHDNIPSILKRIQSWPLQKYKFVVYLNKMSTGQGGVKFLNSQRVMELPGNTVDLPAVCHDFNIENNENHPADYKCVLVDVDGNNAKDEKDNDISFEIHVDPITITDNDEDEENDMDEEEESSNDVENVYEKEIDKEIRLTKKNLELERARALQKSMRNRFTEESSVQIPTDDTKEALKEISACLKSMNEKHDSGVMKDVLAFAMSPVGIKVLDRILAPKEDKTPQMMISFMEMMKSMVPQPQPVQNPPPVNTLEQTKAIVELVKTMQPPPHEDKSADMLMAMMGSFSPIMQTIVQGVIETRSDEMPIDDPFVKKLQAAAGIFERVSPQLFELVKTIKEKTTPVQVVERRPIAPIQTPVKPKIVDIPKQDIRMQSPQPPPPQAPDQKVFLPQKEENQVGVAKEESTKPDVASGPNIPDVQGVVPDIGKTGYNEEGGAVSMADMLSLQNKFTNVLPLIVEGMEKGHDVVEVLNKIDEIMPEFIPMIGERDIDEILGIMEEVRRYLPPNKIELFNSYMNEIQPNGKFRKWVEELIDVINEECAEEEDEEEDEGNDVASQTVTEKENVLPLSAVVPRQPEEPREMYEGDSTI